MWAYREHAPAPALRPYVACYWTSAGRGGAHRVLPDGCVDILVEGRGGDASAVVVGTMTTALLVGGEARGWHVAVRFRPGRAFPFLRASQRTLVDLSVGVDDLWRPESDWLEAVAAAPGPEARVRALEAELLRRLPAAAGRGDVAVAAAVRHLEAARGGLAVGALAARLGVTRQHLARRFREEVGVSPKVLARVLRLQALVGRVGGARRVDWARAAAGAGYCDQPHLIDEFRALAGVTPERWLRGE